MSLTPPHASSFQLRSDEVHSWRVSLDVSPQICTRLSAALTPDERRRSARFRFEHDRRRFIVAHGALREILARYLQIGPGRIRYVYNPFGKPDLSPDSCGNGTRLKFNLTHSAGLALIAIAIDSDIGVDVEYIRPQPDYAEIAQGFFSAAEVDSLNKLPRRVRDRAFFSCWTRTEACMKACGEGLTNLGVGSNDFSPSRRWSLYKLRPARGYVGALAIEGGGWRLAQWDWQISTDPLSNQKQGNE